jgi:hypothetical protein
LRFPLAGGQPAEVFDGFGGWLPPFKADLDQDLPNPDLGFVGAHGLEGTKDLRAGLAENEVARSFCPP